MSTLKTTNLQHASAASPAIVLASDSTATLNGLAYPTSGSLSGRNRVINGSMTVDQRNAGASVTINGGANFSVDRFTLQDDTDGSFTGQRSTTAPAGFTNSLLITVASPDSTLSSTQVARILHRIEGFNVGDLKFGTASASTVTLSFWVRSSEIGTYGGSLVNSAFDRSYPFSYTISVANTFEYKTITIAGDTAGTWLSDSGIGIEINFSLGAGSTYSGTANAWTGSGLISSTGAKNLMATNGATFYITGVQLEAGSVATPFEQRSFTTELQLCQRYYYASQANKNIHGTFYGGAIYLSQVWFPVFMRTAPTATVTGGNTSSPTIGELGQHGFIWYQNFSQPYATQVTASAEL